jgi:PRC-barrel domain
MSRMLLGIAGLFLASVALAQTAPPPPPQPTRPGDPARPRVETPPAATADAGRAYRVKQLLGTKVSLKGDISIGTVDDVVISDAGDVEYLIVANDGKLVTVPWGAAKFNFEKQTATLEITQDQYRAIPTYTVREYPTFFEPTYRTQVYGWYGLKPRAWRR